MGLAAGRMHVHTESLSIIWWRGGSVRSKEHGEQPWYLYKEMF